MNLRELLLRDFEIDFPISGGTGNLKGNPIVIHRQNPNDYTSIEYEILKCLGIGRGIEWNLIQQTVISHNDRTLDQLKVETKEVTDSKIITQTENYYFDITECVNF